MTRFLRFLAKAYGYEPTRMLINGILIAAAAGIVLECLLLWMHRS